ncbi:MAG TPA: CAP domain-containing protein [Actinomycetes bacterium]|nr:CAP domain-containing protein [Actinomycetes bacterium]
MDDHTARPTAPGEQAPRRHTGGGRGRALAALVAVLAVVTTAFVAGAATAGPAGATSVEDVFTSQINQARAERGIPRLAVSAALVRVARGQAARMADQNLLYHNPNLTTEVTNWRWVGENVGYGPDALTVVVAFMESAPHKANILDRDYTQVGVGAVTVGDRVWVAEVFRRPLRVSTTPRLASFQHTLRLGSNGAAVSRIQARLHLSQTGYYGTYTKAAVSRFQRSLGWRGRGNCGPHTWHRLFS